MSKKENIQEKSRRILEFDKILTRLAGYTVSAAGKELALSLEPSVVPGEIMRAQKETTEAKELWQTSSRIPLDGIHSVEEPVKGAQRGRVLSPEELLAIGSTLRTARLIKKFLVEEKKAQAPVLSALAAGLALFPAIEKAVDRALDPEGTVRDDASPRLCSLRVQAKKLQNRIRDQLEAYIRSGETQKYLQEALVTLRNGRYVLPVKQECKQMVPGIVHDQSASGVTLFIEPMAVADLNNRLRRVEAEEEEEIERILAELSGLVGEAAPEILANLKILARLDLAFAKGRYSLALQATEPLFNTRGYIRLLGARHPLLEGEVVPIDLELGGEFHTLVITGPNTGGKTVSLKTVGLLVLMAQAGLHLPARSGSETAVFTKVYSDIGDEQSIEQSLSTFSSHMSNIVAILQEAAGESCLVLLDELGAGTDPEEGSALAVAILQTLHERRVRTVATTHYSNLKLYAYNTPGVQNASVEFDPYTLRPTYRLITGLPGQSNAFAIAARLGLDRSVIAAAEKLVDPGARRVEDLISRITGEKKGLEKEREKAALLRVDLEKKVEEYTEKLARLEKERDRLLREAREEARTMIRETRKKMENILRRLREAAGEEQVSVANEARGQLAEMLRAMEPAAAPAGKAAEGIIPGKTVRLPHLGQKGRVLDVKNEEARIELEGGLRVWAPLGGLVPVAPEEEQKPAGDGVKTVRPVISKKKMISSRIDLRGMTVEEALAAADKYLDEAVLAGLPSVLLIHGKGTGALRSAVSGLLREHPQVKGYRPGGLEEGGIGVTVVELNK